AWLREFNDIRGIPWKTIEPNRYYDWINQRSGEFESHPAIGSKESMQEGVIFALYSGGLKTNRDAWAYNFSKTNLENNMKKMIGEFNEHAKMVKMGLITKENINSTIEDNPKKISW